METGSAACLRCAAAGGWAGCQATNQSWFVGRGSYTRCCGRRTPHLARAVGQLTRDWLVVIHGWVKPGPCAMQQHDRSGCGAVHEGAGLGMRTRGAPTAGRYSVLCRGAAAAAAAVAAAAGAAPGWCGCRNRQQLAAGGLAAAPRAAPCLLLTPPPRPRGAPRARTGCPAACAAGAQTGCCCRCCHRCRTGLPRCPAAGGTPRR